MQSIKKCLYVVQNGKCFYCAEQLSYWQQRGPNDTDGFTSDHVFPRLLGFSRTGNIVLSCYHCNATKGHRLPSYDEVQKARGLYERMRFPFITDMLFVNNHYPSQSEQDRQHRLQLMGHIYDIDNCGYKLMAQPIFPRFSERYNYPAMGSQIYEAQEGKCFYCESAADEGHFAQVFPRLLQYRKPRNIVATCKRCCKKYGHSTRLPSFAQVQKAQAIYKKAGIEFITDRIFY